MKNVSTLFELTKNIEALSSVKRENVVGIIDNKNLVISDSDQMDVTGFSLALPLESLKLLVTVCEQFKAQGSDTIIREFIISQFKTGISMDFYDQNFDFNEFLEVCREDDIIKKLTELNDGEEVESFRTYNEIRISSTGVEFTGYDKYSDANVSVEYSIEKLQDFIQEFEALIPVQEFEDGMKM